VNILEKKYKSYIPLYWFGLVVDFAIILLLRFTILRNASDDELFNFIIIFLFTTTILMMIIWFIEGMRLNNYMYKYHNEYWNSDKVTSSGYLSYNTLYKLKQLEKDNLNDSIVEQIKLDRTSLTIFIWTSFMCIAIILFIIMA
jgi:hypothetical protein